MGETSGGYRRVLYTFIKPFSCATFHSVIVCLYLEPYRSYKASKLTILEKYGEKSEFRINTPKDPCHV